MDFLMEFLMDFTSSGSSELGGDLQKNEFCNSQNRRYHENRGEISCRTVVARGRGLVSLTIS